MARIDAYRDLQTEYGDDVSVGAADLDDGYEVVVTILHNVPGVKVGAEIAMTVADAHRLAVALYSVITEVEAKAAR